MRERHPAAGRADARPCVVAARVHELLLAFGAVLPSEVVLGSEEPGEVVEARVAVAG